MIWLRTFPVGPLIIAAAVIYTGAAFTAVAFMAVLLAGFCAGFAAATAIAALGLQENDRFAQFMARRRFAQERREPIWPTEPPRPKVHRLVTCWEVLDISPEATVDEIKAAYKAKAKIEHPDAGGLQIGMARLNIAKDKALAARGVE